jgi:basic membrane lipoprotein Med (substrate-binding protein (PBP1-ABC) superfamily)
MSKNSSKEKKNMKRMILLVGLLALALAIVACGGGTTTEPTTVPEVEQPVATEEEPAPAEPPNRRTAEPFRVAVVMPSAINDLAFSQSIFDALTAIRDEMGAENFQFDYSDNLFVVDDAAAAIRDYASQGYDLVIAHGSQYGSSLQEIAPDFPDTSFAWGTTADTFGVSNIYAYEAASNEGGYVNGVLAANISESNILGVVGPIETGDAKLYVDGFVAGAKAAKPDIQVNVIYTGSFSDVALASETANTHVSAGADAMSGTAQMVVGAIQVAQERNVAWFGTQSSQTSLAPGVVVANQIYDWTVVLDDIIANVKNGVLGGESYVITLANSGLYMEYNPDYDLPAEVRAAGDAAAAAIAAGTLDVFGGGPAPAPGDGESAAPAEPTEPLTFGMVLVGPRNDRGWSQAHYEGGQFVEENLPGSTMIAFESLNPGDKPEATLEGVVDDMVADGATLIFTTSDEFEEDTLGVAQKYPDVTFINISGDDAWIGEAPPNLGNMMGRMEDMKAIAGCAAALATETGQLGYLGPLINFETRRLTARSLPGRAVLLENYRGHEPRRSAVYRDLDRFLVQHPRRHAGPD